MKRLLTHLIILLWAASAFAQDAQPDSLALAAPAAQPARYGYCSKALLLESMPEYVQARQQLQTLRSQLQTEAERNETEFRRQYSEYLNGQKDFPQIILLKRQRDLQELMEKGIAFRTQADSLLLRAEDELMLPLRRRIESAIRLVAEERGYEWVADTDKEAFLFIRPELSEDITTYVIERLNTPLQ